jgi:hypothetical protein
MVAWNACELPPSTITSSIANVHNVLVISNLYLEDALSRWNCIANVCKFSILGNLLPNLGANVTLKIFCFLLLVVVSSHKLRFDPL